MQIQVVSKGIDVSEALRERIQARVEDAIEKFAHRPGEAFIVVEREGHGFRVDCSVHLSSGMILQTRGSDSDAYKAAESALTRMEKRLRRYNRKLTDHRASRGESRAAAHMVLQSQATDHDTVDDSANDTHGPTEPIIVAESTADVSNLTVGMAVFELELANAPVLVFRNAAHGEVNIVYRRPDGHIGWIDPERSQTNAAKAS